MLNKQDTIGVFLPSSPAKEPFRSIGNAQLKAMGYQVREVEHTCSILKGADYLSREPQLAFEDIQGFFNDPDIKALWAGRGGYGSNLMLPLLEKLEVPEPKMVIGSSDVSYLLWYLLDRFGMTVFYGPMVYSSIAENRIDLDNLELVLSGNYHGLRFAGKHLKSGTARAILTGGCLSNFVSLLGTPYEPVVTDRILLLEDVGERPYRLDRMFWQLENAGVFSRIKGLILGEFPGCFKIEKEKHDFLERITYYLKPYDIPVIFGLPLGHCNNIHTIPLGAEVTVDTSRFSGVTVV